MCKFYKFYIFAVVGVIIELRIHKIYKRANSDLVPRSQQYSTTRTQTKQQ